MQASAERTMHENNHWPGEAAVHGTCAGMFSGGRNIIQPCYVNMVAG